MGVEMRYAGVVTGSVMGIEEEGCTEMEGDKVREGNRWASQMCRSSEKALRHPRICLII